MDSFVSCLENGEAALIITNTNRRYLTGFESSLGYLFVTRNKATLMVDGRYILAAKQTVKNANVVLLYKPSEQLTELLKAENIKTVLLESSISVAQFKRFNESLQDVVCVADGRVDRRLSELREIKSEYEMECIVSAQRIAEKAFAEILNFLKPGVSEREIAAELEYRMKLLGSEGESFDTIVVSGAKSAMPHGTPDGKKIENGDFVTMDFGATFNGYCSDMTRTVAVGHATDMMIDVYNTVLAAQKAAENTVKSGVLGADVDKAARDVIAGKGYGKYFTHSTGHSIGLEVHESPAVSPKSDAILKSGNIITNEPGIYIDEKFGVRIEDMLLVTDSGCKNLTKCEKTLIIL